MAGINAQWTVFGSDREMQPPFDAAVVMPSIGRKEILRAVGSVYRQKGVERIQLLIGLDTANDDLSALLELLGNPPEHVTPCLFYPGYSTNVVHGGLYPATDGGALRTTLTYLANSRHIAYLDDDNWWDERHLTALLSAIQGRAWAFSLRWFVHPGSFKPLCVDELESVGPGKGIFVNSFGGHVDPNCMMIDKFACNGCIGLWNIPLRSGLVEYASDRNIYRFLQQHSIPGETGMPSAYYVMNPDDALHLFRLNRLRELHIEY
jgi:hypothetical protein